ncbi:deoxyribodipyrimidine photolyase [Limnobacter humi]|uniref:Deoxyribodipyrimidine photolyase n=1 Tax=Limnobacter humi TaxID=1778671 RepID=A0ABT1WJC9_9BURK|nr:FAD-binding domain-containing protein [Limnobacter humi]MCQ8897611.1 deoxyribodipyrimidine photolyase [Limnobacter humi]
MQQRFLPDFAPTRQAALTVLARVNPLAYSKTRNFLDGAVTHLAPWITHGFISVREATQAIHQRHPLSFEDKLVFEFAWREFFKHVHGELGDGILKDVRRPVWGGRYATDMPADILEARTGVAAIDAGVQQLYETGYIHNHTRMWIASYTVHLRKVHWRAGADWMYAHLLDGDLASNHLSWQWVAGTFSHKPYVFNAENVRKYARHLDCSGTCIDTDYESLEATARSKRDVGPERGVQSMGADIPLVLGSGQNFWEELDKLTQTIQPNDQPWAFWVDTRQVGDDGATLLNVTGLQPGDTVRWVHPWDLGCLQSQDGMTKIGVLDAAFHADHPWSERRWRFVLEPMRRHCQSILVVDSRRSGAMSQLRHSLMPAGIQGEMAWTLNPGYNKLTQLLPAQWSKQANLLPNPGSFQQSFSRFYREATSMVGSLDEALGELALESQQP